MVHTRTRLWITDACTYVLSSSHIGYKAIIRDGSMFSCTAAWSTVLYISSTIIQVHSAANVTLAHFLLYLVKSWHGIVEHYLSGFNFVWTLQRLEPKLAIICLFLMPLRSLDMFRIPYELTFNLFCLHTNSNVCLLFPNRKKKAFCTSLFSEDFAG